MLFRVLLFFGILLFISFSGFITSQVILQADQAFRVATAARDAVMFAGALAVLIRQRQAAVSRWFLFFLVASMVTVVFNLDNLSLPTQLNGLRQPLFMLSSLVVMHDMLMSSRSETVILWMDRFLIFFALAQFPLSIYQFLKYGAGDAVGGSYGLTGGSGMVTVLLFVIVFYLLVRYGSSDDGESFAVGRILPFSLILAPVAMNETKISFVFLAMYLGFLVLSRRKFYKAIPILGLGALLAYMLVEMYAESVQDPSSFLTDREFLERYLLYDPRPGMDIPRFQKLMIMFNEMWKQVSALVVGYGYGLFVGENILGRSSYVKSFWYTEGTRPALFSIWMQGGILAVIGMLGAVFSNLLRSLGDAAPTVKRYRWFLVVILAATLVYNEAIMNRPFAIIFAYISAWLAVQATAEQGRASASEGESEDEASTPYDDTEGALAGVPRAM
jgi:hypothetical protein